MDNHEAFGHSRREVLQALATASAAVTAAALPAGAQETARPRAGATSESPIAQTLADYAVKLRYEDLPAEVVRTVKRTIIDTIGCAIGGYEAGPSQIAL
jgi:2-methylcitrate dehydratase